MNQPPTYDELEAVNIDIQDTVSSITDNKLEYNPSTQGPSFADLFADVQPLQETFGAHGDFTQNVPSQKPTRSNEVRVNDSKVPAEFTEQNTQLNTEKAKPFSQNGDAIPQNNAPKQSNESNVREQNYTILYAYCAPTSTQINNDSCAKDGQDFQDFADISDVDLTSIITSQNAKRKEEENDDEFDFEPVAKEKPPMPRKDAQPEKSALKQPQTANQPCTQNTTQTEREATVTPSIAITPASNLPPQPSLSSQPENEVVKQSEPSLENSVKVNQAEDESFAADKSAPADPDEWVNVQTIVPAQRTTHESTPVIHYNEALQHLLSSDLDQYKGQIVRTIPRSGFKKFKHVLFGPPKLHKGHHEQRDQYLCLTQCQFANSVSEHTRMLQTINKRLTGAKFDSPRYGSHWEHIGFQGNDPSTDLRGCGMLGLLQLLYISTTPKYLPLTRHIYRLSLHETQNFPFSIMAINMTRLTVQALKEESVNKEINRQHDGLLEYMMKFYMATFYHLYSIWKSQHKTIADTGFVLRDVEAYIKKNPARVLSDLEEKLSSNSSIISPEMKSEEPIQFTKLGD